MSDLYSDIRPYRDVEVRDVVNALLADDEFIDTLVALQGNKIATWLPVVSRFYARRALRKQLSDVSTVDAFQALVKPRLDRVVAATSVFSSAGIEKLDATQSYLFVSNHRDIAMDSAYANIVLVTHGHRTAQVAIGDNLLQKPWVSDLMRINKSFIVKRSLSGPKQQLAASKQLAGFIRESISENRGPIWIAQREGRAKDGDDCTEAAVLKMVSLSRDKRIETADQILGKLNIVPITIAYELDPCDVLKAQELSFGEGYTKKPFEDLSSIAQGIQGQKGCVHLRFGEPLNQETLSVTTAVELIDAHMIDHYRVFQTNLWAVEALGHPVPATLRSDAITTVSREQFMSRFDLLSEAERHAAFSMYARPVLNWVARHEKD